MLSPVPFNEEARLQALVSCNVLDTAPEPEFERLVDIAKTMFRVPIALISFVDENRQWFKARRGLDAQETPRNVAFCAYNIIDDGVLVVENALDDPRFRDNPLVTGAPDIRFYAGAPMVDENGFRLGSFCIIDTKPRMFRSEDDITALQHLADMAADLLTTRNDAPSNKQEATNNDRAKEEFIALISHELRTPLNAINGFAEIIRNGVDVQTAQDYAKTISLSGQHLLRLINKVLDFSQIDSGEVKVNEADVGVENLIDEVCSIIAGPADSSGIKITTQCPAAPVTVAVDRGHMTEVISNLLLNAIDADATEICVEISHSADHNLAIACHDNGCGIPGDGVERAMKAFEIPDSVYTRKASGLGLGLPISKRLVELHGGDLNVRPGPNGNGTTVEIILPNWRVRSPASVA